MNETCRDLVRILFQEELSSDSESPAAVVCNESGHPNRGRGRNLVLQVEGENIAQYGDNSRTNRRA